MEQELNFVVVVTVLAALCIISDFTSYLLVVDI